MNLPVESLCLEPWARASFSCGLLDVFLWQSSIMKITCSLRYKCIFIVVLYSYENIFSRYTFSWRFLTRTNYFCGDNTAMKMLAQTWRHPNFCGGHWHERPSWKKFMVVNLHTKMWFPWRLICEGYYMMAECHALFSWRYLYFRGVYFLFSFTLMKSPFSSSSTCAFPDIVTN